MKKEYISPSLDVRAVKVESLLLGTTFETDSTDNTGGTSGQPGSEDNWNPSITTAKGGLSDWDNL